MAQAIMKCNNCGKPKLRHAVCKCGYYMGEKVVDNKRTGYHDKKKKGAKVKFH